MTKKVSETTAIESERKCNRRSFFSIGATAATATAAVAALPLTQALAEDETGSLGYLNIVDYGADPTGTQDSTQAVQAAITAAKTSGRAVFVPAGTYVVGTLTIPKLSASNWEFTLLGESRKNSILLQSGPLVYTDTNAGMFNFSNLTFQAADDFAMPAGMSGAPALMCLSMHYASTFRRLYFAGTVAHADTVSGLKINKPWGSLYESLLFHNLAYGVLLGAEDEGIDATHNLFVSCTFQHTRWAGILARGMQGGGFVGCSFEGNDGVGAVIMNQDKSTRICESVLFEGNYVTRNGEDVTGTRAWLTEYGAINFGVDFGAYVNNPDPDCVPDQGTRIFHPQIVSNRIVISNSLKYGLLVKCRSGLQLVNNRIEEGWDGNGASVGIDLYNTANSRIEGNVKLNGGPIEATFVGLPWAGAHFDNFFSDLYLSSLSDSSGHGTEEYPLNIALNQALRMVKSGGTIHIEGEIKLPADFTCKEKAITIKSFGSIGGTLYDNNYQSSLILPSGCSLRLEDLKLDLRYTSAGFQPSLVLAGGELTLETCTFVENASPYKNYQYLISGSGLKGTVRMASITNPSGIRLDGSAGLYVLAGHPVTDFDWNAVPTELMLF